MNSISKVKKKNIPKSINEMSKETLQETLKKKKECDAKALKTIEKLLEENVDEEWFLENLHFINQCHFDDAIVERAISKICGYPLCNQKLDKIPTQQYHISTKYNKVFDISERKNFCSNQCYKFAMYVKKQLFTSPLWFRDQEVIPKYKVLRVEETSVFKEEVFFQIKQDKDVLNRNNSSDGSIDELAEKYSDLAVDISAKVSSVSSETKIIKNIATCVKKSAGKISNAEKEINKKKVNVAEFKNSSPEAFQSVSDETVRSKNSDAKKTETKIREEPINVVRKVEKYISEWFSVDTLFFLYTEEKLKELFQDKAVRIKEVLNSKLSVMKYNENIDRIIRLYDLFSSVFSENETKKNLKPLPDYSVLKEEGKKLEIKVKAFYQGQLELEPTKKKETKFEDIKTDCSTIYLPLIDAHAQSALRRKIILDKLNRVLPELIYAFGTDYILQISEVRSLVSTFTLGAHNITLKPREWYLVGIIIIKLLCIKDKHLEKIIQLESSKSQIGLILSNYELQYDYLDDLVLKLTNDIKLFDKVNDR